MATDPPEVEHREGAVVVRPGGDVDLETAGTLRETALLHVGNDAAGLVVDLSRVDYLDSAGIGVLFAIANRLEEHRQRLVLAVPPESLILHSLAVVHMVSRAAIEPSVDEALARLRA